MYVQLDRCEYQIPVSPSRSGSALNDIAKSSSLADPAKPNRCKLHLEELQYVVGISSSYALLAVRAL